MPDKKKDRYRSGVSSLLEQHPFIIISNSAKKKKYGGCGWFLPARFGVTLNVEDTVLRYFSNTLAVKSSSSIRVRFSLPGKKKLARDAQLLLLNCVMYRSLIKTFIASAFHITVHSCNPAALGIPWFFFFFFFPSPAASESMSSYFFDHVHEFYSLFYPCILPWKFDKNQNVPLISTKENHYKLSYQKKESLIWFHCKSKNKLLPINAACNHFFKILHMINQHFEQSFVIFLPSQLPQSITLGVDNSRILVRQKIKILPFW